MVSMDIERVTPTDAERRRKEGAILLDVRSMPEFAEEHPEGAHNVPFLHKTPNGMIPNQDFARVIEFLAPDRDQPIVTHCQMGGRSMRAAAELRNMGYTKVVDMLGGFGSEKNDAGEMINEGWKDAGLPVESGEPDDRSYKSLAMRLNAAESDDASGAPEEASSAADPDPSEDGANRFASATRRVNCAKHGRELPGLKRRPYPGPLGERIFAEISALAWDEWVEHSKMIINEYRINAADPSAVQVLMEQCEQYFFGEGAVSKPEGYVPT